MMNIISDIEDIFLVYISCYFEYNVKSSETF